MIERPILFTSEMVRAVLEGRKVQARRVITERYCFSEAELTRGISEICLEKAWTNNVRSYLCVPYRHVKDADFKWEDCGSVRINPPYKPGDVLWVREKIRTVTYDYGPEFDYDEHCIEYLADNHLVSCDKSHDEWWYHNWHIRPSTTIPSIHMPKWACRIFLAVKNVRVERGYTKRGCGWNANTWVWTIDFEKKEKTA